MSRRSILAASSNISVVWGRAFAELAEPGVDELLPLVVNISGFDSQTPQESAEVRKLLDTALEDNERTYRPDTTANLIFPENLWLRYRNEGADAFFRRYLSTTLPRLQLADSRNSRGTYFERMLAYGNERENQLKQIFQTRVNGNKRRSALQVLIFDPTKDRTDSPYLDFPCLDYVAFSPDADGGLSVTAFYAMQYIFDRAYGNYLGLCALGRFVAAQFGLEFRQLTSVASIAKLGGIGKQEARGLRDKMRQVLPEIASRSSNAILAAS